MRIAIIIYFFNVNFNMAKALSKMRSCIRSATVFSDIYLIDVWIIRGVFFGGTNPDFRIRKRRYFACLYFGKSKSQTVSESSDLIQIRNF